MAARVGGGGGSGGGGGREHWAAAGGREGFKNMIRLLARLAYAGECPPRDALEAEEGERPVLRNKLQTADTSGMGVLVLDFLAEAAWVNEDSLGEALHLHHKQIRRVVRYFEQEQLLVREHVRTKVDRKPRGAEATVSGGAAGSSAGGAGSTSGAAAAAGDEDEGEAKPKLRTHGYCAIDYARAYDVAQLRLHLLKKKLKAAAADSDDVEPWVCSRCGHDYTSSDAGHLYNPRSNAFECGQCDGPVVSRREYEASRGGGGGGSGSNGAAAAGGDRRAYADAKRDVQQRADKQFKPLADQLAKLRDATPPDFGPLIDWSRQMKAEAAARGGRNLAVDAQGIPIFSVDLDTAAAAGGAGAEEEQPARAKIAVPWLQRPGQQQQQADVDAAADGATAAASGLPSSAAAAGMGLAAVLAGGAAGATAAAGGGAKEGAAAAPDAATADYMAQFMAAMREQAQAIYAGGAGADIKPDTVKAEAPAGASGVSPLPEPAAKKRRTEEDGGGWGAAVKLEDGSGAVAVKPEPGVVAAGALAAVAAAEGEDDELAWEDAGAGDGAGGAEAAAGAAAGAAGVAAPAATQQQQADEDDDLDWE